MSLHRVAVKNPYPYLDDDEALTVYAKKKPVKKEPASEGEEASSPMPEKRPTGDLCFDFSNPVRRDSFEGAIQIAAVDGARTEPNFRSGFYYQNPVTATDEERELARTPADLPHLTACVSADLRFNTTYEVRFTKPILDRDGQALDAKSLPQPIRFTTMHSALEASLDVTKNIFNAKALPKVPFSSINAERVDIRLVRCEINSDTLRSAVGSCLEARDANRPSEGPESSDGQTEPEAKEDPLSRKVAIDAPYDVYHHGKIDLASLYPGLKPGLYEIEATFRPMSEITLKKKVKKLGVEQEALIAVDPVVVSKRIQLTETALAMKAYENRFLIWALDIATGEPRANLPLQIWKEDTLVATGQTDAEGLFDFANNTINLDYDETLSVIVDDPQAFGFLSSKDKEGIDPASFGVAYERPRHIKNYFSFLHTDRPLYRPEQKVHFSGFLRSAKDGVYSLASEIGEIKVTIADPEGSVVYEKALPVSDSGAFGGEWQLGDDEIPRGLYQITASIPTLDWSGQMSAQTFTKAFYVSSYKKPDFKLSFTPDRKETLSGETIRLTAKGAYFFGAPLSKARIQWSIRQEGFRFSPEKFRDYLFVDEEAIQKSLKRVQEDGGLQYEEREGYEGDRGEVAAGVYFTDSDSHFEDPKIKPDKPAGPSKTGLSSLVVPTQNGQLDPEGLFTLEYTPQLANLPTSQIYTATLTAKELGQEISTVADLRIHGSGIYVGLKPERQVYARGQNFTVDLVTLDPEAKPVPGHGIALKLYKRDYMTVKKRTENGSWVFESEPKDTLLLEKNLASDGEGKAVFSHLADQGGVYRVVAATQDAKGRSMTAAVHVGVGGDPDAAWKISADDRLSLVPDKPSYRVGETAQLLIPFPTQGMTGLMTIEKGGIREKRLLKFAPGQNTLSVPIQAEHIPNIYVSLLLFRPQGAEAAMMKVGLAELKVEPEKKKLDLALRTEKEIYAPKEKVRVDIKATDSAGQGAAADLVVSVADESVLRLIDYESPNLLRRFYFNRKLGVATAENMIHYKSGDGAAGSVDEEKKRSKFLDTAFFTSSVRTDAAGAAQVDFELPDNLTTWVIEILAVSEDTKVGSDFKTIRTQLPIFLRPALPRFLAVEDEADVAVFVENPSDRDFEGSVSLQASDAVISSGQASQSVSVAAGGRSPLYFPLKGLSEGKARLGFTAQDSQKQKRDILELSLPIEDRSLPVLYTANGATRAEAVERLEVPAGARKDRGGLSISVATTPAKLVKDAVGYLLAYPYGCAEQRTSAMIGLWQLLQFSQSLKTLPEPFQKLYDERYAKSGKPVEFAELQRTLEKTLASLYAFQKPTGGFSFWKNEAMADAFLSADIARAFRLFSDSGVAVDPGAKRRLAEYLGSLLAYQKPLPAPPRGKPDLRRYEAEARATLAWGLSALDAKAALPAVKSLFDMKKTLGPRGLAATLLAIKNSEKEFQFNPGQIAELLDELRDQRERRKTPQGPQSLWNDASKIWDATTTSAVALQALLAYDPQDETIEEGLRFLLGQAKQGNFGHTLATRESLIALGRYSSLPRDAKNSVPTTLDLGGEKRTVDLPAYSLSRWLEDFLPLEKLAAKTQPVDLKLSKPEQAPGALYYQSALSAYFPIDQVPRREDGVIVAREFYAIDDAREERPLRTFKLGESYKASLTVMVPSEIIPRLTVEHLLPAGFEPVDFELSTSNQELAESLKEAESENPGFKSALFSHEEIHDDRVMWTSVSARPGIYKIRHVVRAATPGVFLAPGATAFAFYDADYFGRSRSMAVKIEK